MKFIPLRLKVKFLEIYTFEVEGEISKDEMIGMFEDSPQYFAELIREKGNKIYSDYSGKKKVIS